MTLAIIGAGISGCAATWALRGTKIRVHLFEKSRGVSGRAATRRRHAVCYDHGANYVKPTSERVRDVIQHQLPTDDLVDIDRPVWIFDGEGTLRPGDDRDDYKWTYRRGINTLGKVLLAPSEAELHLQTRVQHLHLEGAQWHIADTAENAYGPYDTVLLTPPAPQAADLIAASTFDKGIRDTVLAGLRAATYRSQFCIVCAYDQPVARPGDFYALVNTDGAHPVAWLSFEEDKPGHVPEGSLVVVQMSPAWTRSHYDEPHETLVAHATELISDLLEADLRRPAWTDYQRWRYALPDASADTDALDAGRAIGLFFAGDALPGKGRVGLALESGLDAAGVIQEHVEGV